MLTKVLSFTGVECYDLILYIARVYKQLGKQVLIVDNSVSQSLSFCVPGLVDAKAGTPVDFGGITATKHIVAPPASFDFILIYTGKHSHEIMDYADRIFLVTDYQKHNIEQLLETELADDEEPVVIFRDRVTSKITPDTIMARFTSNGFNVQTIQYLEDTTEDLASKVLCQYNTFDQFKRVSSSVKDLIIKVVSEDFDEKEVTKALKQAARRW